MNKKTLVLSATLLLVFTLACNLFNPELFSGDEVDAPEEALSETATEAVPEMPPPAAQSDNPCNNIFYPLVPGTQQVYKNENAEKSTQFGITVAGVEGNIATVDMLDIGTGIITQSSIECDAGAIKYFPAVSMGTVFGNMLDGTLDMEYVSGYIAPSEEVFEDNNWDMAWESQYVMNGDLIMEDEGETFVMIIQESPVVMHWQIETIGESLTVGAGSYTNVIKVTREITIEFSIDLGLTVVGSTLTINSTHWFEPYVGMLKMQIDSGTVEYTGMSFPIAISETMELIEFHPAE